MKRHSLTVVAAALAAAALTSGALAAAAAKDARTMVLRKADFPAGTRSLNVTGNRSSYGLTFRYAGPGGRNDLTSGATVTASRSAAVAGFRELKSDYSKNVPTLVLPKYGDEQHVSFLLGTAQLIVRKNTVVWVLTLARTGSSGSNPNEIKKREATAELKKYAAIQARRVGGG